MAMDEGLTINVDFGEYSPKFTEVMLQRMAEKRIYDNTKSPLGNALREIREDIAKKTQLPKELLFGEDEKKKKADAEARKILQDIAGSDSNDLHELSKRIIFGNESPSKNMMRQPFGYSWHRPIGIESDEMTEFVALRLPPSPALRPSPMFYFANLDDIRRRMQWNEDPVNMCITYRYQRNKIICMFRIDINDPVFISHSDDGTLEEAAVRQLAKKYDEAMIMEVFKMNMVEFNRMSGKLASFGGTLEIQGSPWEGMRAIIGIPVDHLSKLAFTDDLLAKKFNAPPAIPEIKDIQVQNQKVVVVYFEDDTFTKSICGEGEQFNVYTGVMVCLFKRMLGESKDETVYGQKKFTRLMAKAMGFFDKKYKARKKALKEKMARVAAQKAREEKNLRKKAKKREEQISIFAEALKRDRQAAETEKFMADARNRAETSSEDV